MNRNVRLTILQCLLTAGFPALYAQSPNASVDRDLAPSGKGIGTLYHPGQAGDHAGGQRVGNAGNGNKSDNGIYAHGGPVMLGTTKIYYIWYGNWGSNTARTILFDLATSIGGSPYFNINTTYTSPGGAAVSNSVAYGNETSYSAYLGNSLSDGNIQAIVAKAISDGLPLDENGVYFVLTSAEVTASSGFCRSYCGWHTYFNLNGKAIKYSFVGNPDRCPSSCAMQTTSPNGNAGADGMASIIAHELEEAVTDPQLNAWYDRRGYENADKCAWTFGATFTAPNGSLANMTMGGRNWLIQQNWVNASGGYCAKKYPN
jgi:hypothetical protein